MIAPQLPGATLRMPVLWSEPRSHRWIPTMATDAGLRQRSRGGLVLDLEGTLYPRHQVVLTGVTAVARRSHPSLWLAPSVVDTLQMLRQQGWRIAVLTNGLPAVQAAKVAALELEALVDHVLYAECYAPGGKPAAAAFHAAAVRLGLPVEWCVCVGDDPVRDIDGAHRAGLHAVQVRRPGIRVSADADAVINTFADLPAAAAALVDQIHIDVA